MRARDVRAPARRAQPALFTRISASSLTNTLVYEVQSGAQQLVYSLLTLVRDSLTLVALLGYLLWLNWKLTLFVGVLFPAVAFVMRMLSRRLHRLTVAGQERDRRARLRGRGERAGLAHRAAACAPAARRASALRAVSAAAAPA